MHRTSTQPVRCNFRPLRFGRLDAISLLQPAGQALAHMLYCGCCTKLSYLSLPQVCSSPPPEEL
jgi:hypothetical protein